jgi:hypothetical protein
MGQCGMSTVVITLWGLVLTPGRGSLGRSPRLGGYRRELFGGRCWRMTGKSGISVSSSMNRLDRNKTMAARWLSDDMDHPGLGKDLDCPRTPAISLGDQFGRVGKIKRDGYRLE